MTNKDCDCKTCLNADENNVCEHFGPCEDSCDKCEMICGCPWYKDER